MQITLVDREEKILDPNMDIVDKIGTMARICYRAEPKEGEDQHAVNLRIIKKCIESGHESILEHGVISVFFNPEETEDSRRLAPMLQYNKPINIRGLWDNLVCDATAKYIEQFMDPDLYGAFNKKNNTGLTDEKVLPCLVGDVRAWRQVIRERVYINTKKGDKLGFALTLKLLKELNDVEPDHVLFSDIVNQVNSLLAQEDFRDHFLDYNIIKFEKNETVEEVATVDTVSNKYFTCLNSVIAGQASKCASLSAIFVTDRATTHQLVRHRKNVAYSQESQRYVNYDKKGLRIITMTMDPSLFINYVGSTEGVTFNDFFADYDHGRINDETELGQKYFKPWITAMNNAAEAYSNMLELKDDKALPAIKPEVARGVLPNDTATIIGVTWLRAASFINLCYWRLESHAQYNIRSMIARLVLSGLETKHPFFELIQHDIVMNWLKTVKDQHIFANNERIDKIAEYREKVNAMIQKYIQEQHEAEAKAKHKDEPKIIPATH